MIRVILLALFKCKFQCNGSFSSCMALLLNKLELVKIIASII